MAAPPDLHALLTLAAEPMVALAPTGVGWRAVAANRPALRLLDASDVDTLSQRLEALREQSLGRALASALADDAAGDWPARVVRGGAPVALRLASAAAPGGLRVVRLRDVTTTGPAAQRAGRDPLTEALSRGHLVQRLDGLVREARPGHGVGLIALDLARFSRINDSLGPSAGDALLVTVGRRLTRLVAERGAVARLDGDAFAVLVTDVADAEALVSWARRIQARLAEPFAVESHTLALDVHVGLALAPQDARTGRELLRLAEAALAEARRAGVGGGLRSAGPLTGHDARARFELETSLRQALAGEEAFYLAFQPQVNLSGDVVAFEVLARWRPRGAVDIPPGDFIHLAEEAGLIDALTRRVIHLATAQVAAWTAAGLDGFRVSVNASPSELHRPDFAAHFLATCAAAGAPPDRFELEVTESAVLRDPQATRATLSELAAAGVRVALDDFGTGHSSLANLRRLPLHTLKIDRSFVEGVPADADNSAICRAVVALGHGLGLEVVAEGVEGAEQRAWLAGLGCDLFQGFGLGRPMTADDAAAWLRARRA